MRANTRTEGTTSTPNPSSPYRRGPSTAPRRELLCLRASPRLYAAALLAPLLLLLSAFALRHLESGRTMLLCQHDANAADTCVIVRRYPLMHRPDVRLPLERIQRAEVGSMRGKSRRRPALALVTTAGKIPLAPERTNARRLHDDAAHINAFLTVPSAPPLVIVWSHGPFGAILFALCAVATALSISIARHFLSSARLSFDPQRRTLYLFLPQSLSDLYPVCRPIELSQVREARLEEYPLGGGIVKHGIELWLESGERVAVLTPSASWSRAYHARVVAQINDTLGALR